MKALSILLAIACILLGGLAYINQQRIEDRNDSIADRENMIDSYQKIIISIGESQNIKPEKLQKALEAKFEVAEMIYYDREELYSIHLYPKESRTSGGHFFGMELILDKSKKFKTVYPSKP